MADLVRRGGVDAGVDPGPCRCPGLHRFFTQHPKRLGRRPPGQANRVWVGDITYFPVGRQWRFLAVVMDQGSRRIVAWALAKRRDARLTRQVFDAAYARRHPRAGLVFHSDRGSEYAAAAFRDRLRALAVQQSAAQRGPKDNAPMESFFHSLKAELIHGTPFGSDRGLRRAVRQYIAYYNQRRLHSALAYRSPVAFEAAAA